MRRALRLGLATLTVAVLAAGCTSDALPATGSGPAPGETTAASKYVELASAIADRGTEVWVEADFVKAYLTGPARYRQVLDIAVDLARRTGAKGIKIADELGYRDGSTPAQDSALVAQAVRDVHAALPGGKVLVDVVVPELGCLDWQPVPSAEMRTCASMARLRDPGASMAAVDGYIASGLDVVDVSPGLRDDSWYADQGLDRDQAMRLSWREAVRRWGSRTRLQARKALAHPGAYPWDAARAEADVHTFVDIPLEEGAKAVDIWTWAQVYQGGLVRLTDPGAAPNALTQALQERRRKGAQLWTHMSPSTLQVGLADDVAVASQMFDAVFVAAGTG
ncbi:hypothetical protein N865_07655 [Intrasporangium oryzae NRRL B-24470]|uniref:Uncharacterized protein n=1 Tax=Intrasporangium oryzae NRRL B-24470 TaxID=1386089 RepID=W9G918_9MICO|nr:hypothetical protein [Intrasporangium oryzae]EWT01752.1 hypothetical protein N865_07655 [Intrasporangium oryzae NRRL B-24470]